MNKTFIVAQYEYLSSIKRISFWLTTLFFPIFIGVISLISGYSSSRGEELLTEMSKEIKSVLINDTSNLISSELIQKPFEYTNDINFAKQQIQNGKVDALIIYPKDIVNSQTIEVFTTDKGILSSTSFEETAKALLKQSGFLKVEDVNIKTMITATFNTKTTYIDKSGDEKEKGFTQYIVPAISAIVFFMSVFISAQFLLQSVSEEKENRMMETILSMITPQTLIKGKIIGLSTLVLTQQFIWVLLSGVVLFFTSKIIPVNLPSIDLSSIQLQAIPINLYFIFAGFLFFAAIMVGVGAIGTSYKDSQSLSSIFIILAILPIYFIVLILAEPNGLLAKITSYFPFTAPMVLLVRNSITTMPVTELVASMILVAIYVIIAFWIAIKMFELGALMYNRKPNVTELWYILFKRKG